MRAPPRFEIRTPPDFGLDATVRSHGWFDLAPFRYDAERGALDVVVELDAGHAVAIRVSERGRGRLRLEVRGEARRERVVAALRDMLQLGRDLAPAHRALSGPDYEWVRERGAGRLLRAPTAFEDAVKVLLTTNCSWSATRGMVERLILALGTEAPGGGRAFPTAARMAALPLDFYRNVVRAGYRAGALVELSRAVSCGAVPIDAIRDEARPLEDLRREILAWRGFGPYAADQLLRLSGRFARPVLDSWMRGKWRRLHPRSRATDRAIVHRYASRFGAYAGLALWLDLTRDWHECGLRGDPPVFV